MKIQYVAAAFGAAALFLASTGTAVATAADCAAYDNSIGWCEDEVADYNCDGDGSVAPANVVLLGTDDPFELDANSDGFGCDDPNEPPAVIDPGVTPTPTPTPTATPTPTVTATPTATPTVPAPEATAQSELPVTGSLVTLAIVTGVALLFLGTGLWLVARKRRGMIT